MTPRLTDVFVVREGTSTGGATDASHGTGRRPVPHDPDLEDVDTREQDLELYGEADGWVTPAQRAWADSLVGREMAGSSFGTRGVATRWYPGPVKRTGLWFDLDTSGPEGRYVVGAAKTRVYRKFPSNLPTVVDEAGPGDRSIVQGLGLKVAMVPLSRTPWELSRRTLHPEERRYVKRLDSFHCFVSVLPASEHAGHTNRGRRDQDGWMLDCEVRRKSDDAFVFHTERRFPDVASAEAAQEDVMEFVDGHTLSSLLDVPRSGQLQMTAWRDGGPHVG